MDCAQLAANDRRRIVCWPAERLCAVAAASQRQRNERMLFGDSRFEARHSQRSERLAKRRLCQAWIVAYAEGALIPALRKVNGKLCDLSDPSKAAHA
eukprot:6187169-Pleurochrysis_carterae.AAC.2